MPRRCASAARMGKGLPVQAVHDERAREVKGPSGVQKPRIELLGVERPVCAGHVEKRPLTHRVDKDDGRGGRNRAVAK